MCGEKFTGRVECNFYCLGDGIAVDATTARGEGNTLDTICHSRLQTRTITTRQQNGVLRRAAVDRPHRVDHVARRQMVAFGDLGTARIAATQGLALVEQARPRRAVDRAIHAAAAQ